ncbi:hypothetical protein [Thiohalorhabdus sp.]|uniref:hypothetical protein n=1 Tax=Thiohalorhabdus sp. TaxID=3094134 RepID=UPI002FC2F375
MAKNPRKSQDKSTEAGYTRERRRYYRATTGLRFRILESAIPPRVWLYRQDGEGSAFYQPDSASLENAQKLLAKVPQRNINLSEGGMRIRFPEQQPDLSLVEGGGSHRQRRVHVLLAFDATGEGGAAIFHLPAHLIRVDKLPWARFVALVFYAVPDGLRQRLEGEVMAIERRRLRGNLVASGTTESGDDMAGRLRRMESSGNEAREHQRHKVRRLSRRGRRFFP